MANTVIQIKRSTTTSVPPDGSLTSAEPAYSYLSDKLFLGTSDGLSTIAIGGKFYVDQQNTIFDLANAAFSYANTISSDADEKANAAVITANVAYDAANGAFLNSNVAFDNANAAFLNSNAAYLAANSAFINSNASFDAANAAFLNSNVSFDAANAAFLNSNSAFDSANAGQLTANTAYDKANAANSLAYNTGIGANAYSDFTSTAANNYANATFVKLTETQQTITGNLSITGSLTVSGNSYVIDTETLRIADPLIYLAGNNYISDSVDIGFTATYNNGAANLHTGFFRDHTSKEYYVFQGYTEEPDQNHIDVTANDFTLAVLNADLRTSNLVLGGVNAISWLDSIYTASNSAFLNSNVSFDAANAAFLNSNVSYDTANAAFLNSNSAYLAANAAFLNSNVSFDAANSAFLNSNSGYLAANAAFLNSNSAYDAANAAYINANAAYDFANTANVNAANASYLSVGTVPSGRLTGDYSGITGVGTLINGTWNADTITVPYGGTGVTSFTQNGILYGNTSGALKVTAAGTEGQVLTATATGAPAFSHLDGGNF